MVDSPRVVVTRRAEQAAYLCEQLRARGMTPIQCPAIQLQQLPSEALDEALSDLKRFDWLIFSSSNAVDFFFQRAQELTITVAGPQTAVVGPATARRLAGYQVQADCMPQRFTGQALAAEMGDLQGQRILLPRARLGRPEIVAALAEQGAEVTDIALYDTVTAVPSQQDLDDLAQGYEAITFASPSSVHGFLEISGGAIEPAAVVACIGPVTAGAAREEGLTVTIMPDKYTADGLVDALANYFERQSQVPGTSEVPGAFGERQL